MKLASVTLSTFGCLIKTEVAEVGKILLTKAFQLSWIVLAALVKNQAWYFKLYVCILGAGDFWQNVWKAEGTESHVKLLHVQPEESD